MKVVIESIRRVLRADPLVLNLVGVDKDGEPKVYDEIGKSDIEAPYIVWFVSPGGGQQGTYGEKYTLVELNAQISCWGRNPKEAWQLADAVEDALEKGAYDAGQYEMIQVRRDGFPQPLPDRDTPLFQVAVPLFFKFSSSGVRQ